MVISQALSYLTGELGSRREAELLLMHIADTDMTGILLNRDRKLQQSEEELLHHALQRRRTGEPIQYIIGSCEFMSLEFDVNENVLIPRSDTETLVEFLIEKIGNRKISVLDIGTGSGCIAISLAKYCPNITVDCVDISNEALKTAEKNAEKNHVADRVSFKKLDILSEIPQRMYDVTVSNPPYIRPEVIEKLEVQVKDFEPYTALYGGDDGLKFYRRITDISSMVLKKGGLLAYEIGYDQGEAVFDIMQRDFENVKKINDLCGNSRVVVGSLKENN